MNNSSDWQALFAHIDNDEERALLERLSLDDPDTAEALAANIIENHLDNIGVAKAPAQLTNKLYAIADKPLSENHPKLLRVKAPRVLWLSWGALAATLVLTAVLSPWQRQGPSDEALAQARQQVAIAFYYLDRAVDKSRQQTQRSISESVDVVINRRVLRDSNDDGDEEAIDL